ncbi:nickel ABC transporter substrate-binding protein [Listeria monocytogenes]|nr:nickel ABC transporter substrate-binding protein [Listeria monocytogenes]EAH1013862.1 nickel ABC transporter substrate-binding protein [Listeria monocytogenes]EAH1536942.1 nickel ABC transporter substrate-binding protein [Listeria monocytogenes]EAH2030553.1 nickel ABC transporter substrate-binding protein [Listeria monocytogenes]EAH3110443.1 nickel ABC transporter substrate-binding protein [Listeria monocytogenes]
MKKTLKSVLALLAIVLVLSGCNSTSKKTVNKKKLNTINIAISSEANAEKLDATAYDSSMAIYGAVYEPLIQYGKKGEFQPALATSWEISNNGKKYVFNLDKKAKFSDGSLVNSEAVKFTIERAKLNNKTSTLQTLNNLDRIEIIDANTVALFFKEVSNQVLAELCQTRPLRIMSPNSVEDGHVSGAFKKAIGSGPFVVKESTAEHVLMSPNRYFNDEKPVNYQVDFKTISDGSSRTLALRSGEIDIVGGTLGEIKDSDIDYLKTDKSFTVEEFEGTMSHFLAFNPDNTMLNTAIRHAIELSIDKKLLSDQKLNGLFRENVQFVSKTNQKPSEYNSEKAKTIFENEGLKKNKDGYYEKDNKILSFDLVIQTTEFPEWKEQAEVVESELKKVGVKINIIILDSDSYYDVLWTTKKYDMIFYRTYTDAYLPYNFLNSLYHNTDKEHGVLSNDEELTNQLNEFASMFKETDQQKTADKFLKRISDETLAIPIDYKNEKFAVSEKVSKFIYSGLSDSPIDYKNLKVN